MPTLPGRRSILAAVLLCAVVTAHCGDPVVLQAAVGATDSQADGVLDGGVLDGNVLDGSAADLPLPSDLALSADVPADAAPDAASDDATEPHDIMDSGALDTDAPADIAPADIAAVDSGPAADGAVPDAALEVGNADSESADGASCQVTPEVCDGVDNDCDGETDELAAGAAALCNDGLNCTIDVCAAGACKATAKTCDDKDACTTDSCDGATGGCIAAPMSGCSACSADAACNDSDACTADKCVSGKCQLTKIAGCFGAADFVIDALDLASPSLGIDGAVKWTVTVHNDGKKVSGVALKSWLSEDETISSAVDFALAVDSGSGPNGLGATTPSKALPYTAQVAVPSLQAKFKFLCAQLSYAGDPTPANNLKCAPIAVLLPQWQVTAVKPEKTPWLWNNPLVAYVTNITVKNAGNAAPVPVTQPYLTLYASANDTWDAKDFEIATYKNGTTISLGIGVEQSFALTTTVAAAKLFDKFVCARLSTQAGIKELDLADNVLCVAHETLFVGDLTLAKVVTPGQASNPPTEPPSFYGDMVPSQTGRYGVTPACRMANLKNTGEAAMKDFAVRCWLQTGLPGDANPTKLWEVKSKVTASIQPNSPTAQPVQVANAVISGLADGVITMAPAIAGKPQPKAYTMCMAFNEDGALVEKFLTDNQVCTPVYVTAVDFGWFEATGPAASATTIKAGTASTVTKTNIKNFGSAKSKGGTTPITSVALALSKDNVLSADDIALWTSTPLPAIEPGGALQISNLAAGSTTVGFTIPAGTAPGAYWLVLKIDSANVEPESVEANNAWSAAITVN